MVACFRLWEEAGCFSAITSSNIEIHEVMMRVKDGKKFTNIKGQNTSTKNGRKGSLSELVSLFR